MRQFAFGSNSATTTTGLSVTGLTSLNMAMPAAAPTVGIQFLRHWAGQTQNATSAQQRIGLYTQAAALPTTATSVTPRSLNLGDPNASALVGATTIAAGKVGINITTEGAGTRTLWWDDAFNVLNGFLKVPTPLEVEIMPGGFASASALLFPTAPATLTGWNWGQNYAEV